MDKIILDNIGKRFKKDWIFNNLSYTFHANKSYAIQGSNGSGKSTLLKIVAAYLDPTLGTVSYFSSNQPIDSQLIHSSLTLAAPYMELPEEFTPIEIVKFHLGFKSFYNDISVDTFLKIVQLDKESHKTVNQFSSGMKQRLKLGLAILSKSDLLLLDEPTINLDANGINLFQEWIKKYSSNRIIIICSNNIREEIEFCHDVINVNNFK
ncbi:MAG: ATP-binding cassette domain-containing protein [Bacteroidales bacterium]|nr:ATP-binding cassette domain-containing protein [Bacteroidales bacterium]